MFLSTLSRLFSHSPTAPSTSSSKNNNSHDFQSSAHYPQLTHVHTLSTSDNSPPRIQQWLPKGTMIACSIRSICFRLRRMPLSDWSVTAWPTSGPLRTAITERMRGLLTNGRTHPRAVPASAITRPPLTGSINLGSGLRSQSRVSMLNSLV